MGIGKQRAKSFIEDPVVDQCATAPSSSAYLYQSHVRVPLPIFRHLPADQALLRLALIPQLRLKLHGDGKERSDDTMLWKDLISLTPGLSKWPPLTRHRPSPITVCQLKDFLITATHMYDFVVHKTCFRSCLSFIISGGVLRTPYKLDGSSRGEAECSGIRLSASPSNL